MSIDNSPDTITDMVGQKCIVRTYSAGVWYGRVVKKVRDEVIVENARRLWKWKTAHSISLSAIAVYGVDPDGCDFAPTVPTVWLQAIELIPVSEKAMRSIEGVEDAVAG